MVLSLSVKIHYEPFNIPSFYRSLYVRSVAFQITTRPRSLQVFRRFNADAGFFWCHVGNTQEIMRAKWSCMNSCKKPACTFSPNKLTANVVLNPRALSSVVFALVIKNYSHFLTVWVHSDYMGISYNPYNYPTWLTCC